MNTYGARLRPLPLDLDVIPMVELTRDIKVKDFFPKLGEERTFNLSKGTIVGILGRKVPLWEVQVLEGVGEGLILNVESDVVPAP